MKYTLYFIIFCGFIAYAGVKAVETILATNEEKSDLLTGINDYLVLHDKRPLRRDKRLDCAAEIHAYDAYQRGICSIVSSKGENLAKRASQCNFPWHKGDGIIVCHFETDIETLDYLLKTYHNVLLDGQERKFIGIGAVQNFRVIYLGE